MLKMKKMCFLFIFKRFLLIQPWNHWKRFKINKKGGKRLKKVVKTHNTNSWSGPCKLTLPVYHYGQFTCLSLWSVYQFIIIVSLPVYHYGQFVEKIWDFGRRLYVVGTKRFFVIWNWTSNDIIAGNGMILGLKWFFIHSSYCFQCQPYM